MCLCPDEPPLCASVSLCSDFGACVKSVRACTAGRCSCVQTVLSIQWYGNSKVILFNLRLTPSCLWNHLPASSDVAPTLPANTQTVKLASWNTYKSFWNEPGNSAAFSWESDEPETHFLPFLHERNQDCLIITLCPVHNCSHTFWCEGCCNTRQS